MKKINLIVSSLLILIVFTGCGIKRAIQTGVSSDAYYNVNKNNSKELKTFIKSNYLIFSEIDGEKLANPAELALGIGPRKLYVNPGIHTFKVYTGLSTLTFKHINIQKGHEYFFGYVPENTYWLKDLVDNKVIYGYEPVED